MSKKANKITTQDITNFFHIVSIIFRLDLTFVKPLLTLSITLTNTCDDEFTMEGTSPWVGYTHKINPLSNGSRSNVTKGNKKHTN